jgi:hypothetical protein
MNVFCVLCEPGSVVITVYNVAAEKIAIYNYSGSDGSNVYSLNIIGFAHGVYFFMMQSTGPSGNRQSGIKKFAIIR